MAGAGDNNSVAYYGITPGTSAADKALILDKNEGLDLSGKQAETVADSNTEGGLPQVYRIKVSATAGDTDVTVDEKIRVIDAWCVLAEAGGTSDTLQIKNGSTAITDAMDVSGADKAIVRAGTIDDAQHEISASGTLRVTTVDGSSGGVPSADVYVLAIKVA